MNPATVGASLASRRGIGMLVLFLVTVTIGSGLLFLVQPMCARFVLPLLGGTPAVWTTCMLFFQAGLLAGYGYTHALPRWLGHRNHAWLHAALILLAFALLPIAIPTEAPASAWPVPWLLGTLLLSVGLPYVLLSSNAPLLQRWFAFQRPGRDPYFLYAASNLGSFAGLLAYPFLLEPALTLPEQSEVWRWAYLGLAACTALCALPLLRKNWTAPEEADMHEEPAPPPSAWQKLRWVLLALIPSSLLLSVTNYLTADIAPLPLFWVVPLSLYLLTFVVAFSRVGPLLQGVLIRWSPVAVIVVLLMLLREGTEPVWLILSLHVIAFTVLALLCHTELARTRPPVRHLTGFYLWLALGGVLGGLFNGIVAPLLFDGYLEYPIMLVAVLLLRPRPEDLTQQDTPQPLRGAAWTDLLWPLVLGGTTLAAIFAVDHFAIEPAQIAFAIVFVPPLVASYLFQERPLRLALAMAAILIAAIWHPSSLGRVIYQDRSFFGVHRVTVKDDHLWLVHGNTIHGCQALDRARREPLTYYTRTGPVGVMLRAYEGDRRRKHVGIIGLGAGAIAHYAQPGEQWTFLEIDPVVIHIARDSGYFTFLSDAHERGADVRVVLGDGRLTLRHLEHKLGVLILDAFGSDAIPTHLLTREAFKEYQSRMEDDGVILLNISNRYLKLEPVLANLAKDLGWNCLIWHDMNLTPQEEKLGKTRSIWAVLSWSDPFSRLTRSKVGLWQPAEGRPDIGVWRDDYANLLPLIRWREETD